MSYQVFILPAAEKDCNHLPRNIYERCKKAMLALENNPRPVGCQKLTNQDGYRVRIGPYRILYRIDDDSKTVYVYRLKHRRDVYR